MALFYSSAPASLDSLTVSQHAQYQGPETEVAKWNSAIFAFCHVMPGSCEKINNKNSNTPQRA